MRLKAALIVLIPTLLSASHEEAARGEAKHFAKEVVVKAPDFDDLGNILRIGWRSGQVTLQAPHKKYVWMEVEFYRNGQKLPNTFASGKVGCLDGESKISFVMQTLDTGYLLVGGSKKDHCRLVLGVRVGGASTSGPHDVKNALFDFSRTGGSGMFSAAASSEGRVPLFWYINNAKGIISTDSVERVLKWNKMGDIAIFYLRFSK